MADPVWLGVDLGTQSVRAVAVDEHGNALASAAAPLSSVRNGVTHVQQPADWWRAVCACCSKVTSALNGRSVSAMSVDATSGTVLLMDQQLQPASEALMYDDGRAGEESTEINIAGESYWNEMGYRAQRSWALPKLLWLARRFPEQLSHGCIAHQNDYIHARLVGKRLAADSSHALKSGFDLLHNEWPRELFARIGLTGGLFPDVVAPGAVIGSVSAEAAALTGIQTGCRIVAGMTDGCASQVAAGAVRPGEWNSVLGTTLVVKGASDHRVVDPLGVVYCHRSPSGTWLPGGASSAGAGVLNKLFPGADLQSLDRSAAALGVPNAVMYPLAGAGERFPFTAPQAAAFLIGKTEGMVEEFSAVLAGVACMERLCLAYLRMVGAPTGGKVCITGGATRSGFWNQLRADVLQFPLTVPGNTEAAFGAAVLAASHTCSIESAVNAMVRTREVLRPRREHREALGELYVRLINALEVRRWLPGEVADFARSEVAR